MIWCRAPWNCQTHFWLPESVLFLLKANNERAIRPKSALVFSLEPVGASFSAGQGCEPQLRSYSPHFSGCSLIGRHKTQHCIIATIRYTDWIADYALCVYIRCIYHLKHYTAELCAYLVRTSESVCNMCFSLGFIAFHLPIWARFSPLKPLGLCVDGDMRQAEKTDCSTVTDAKRRTVMLLTIYKSDWMTGNRGVGIVYYTLFLTTKWSFSELKRSTFQEILAFLP